MKIFQVPERRTAFIHTVLRIGTVSILIRRNIFFMKNFMPEFYRSVKFRGFRYKDRRYGFYR
jgi:hypothetical protein